MRDINCIGRNMPWIALGVGAALATALALAPSKAHAFAWHEVCQYRSVVASPQVNVREVPTLQAPVKWSIFSVEKGSPEGSVLYCGEVYENLVEGSYWMNISFYFPKKYDGGAIHNGWVMKGTLSDYSVIHDEDNGDEPGAQSDDTRAPPTDRFVK